jgi:hypothetical protein
MGGTLSLGEQVVLSVCKDYAGKYYHIYFNNFFFLSTELMMLLEKQIYDPELEEQNGLLASLNAKNCT